MRALPNATLVVHERGARHLIDPAKLIAGASAVYGDAEVERMYGEIAGVPQVRVVSPQDGEQLAFGDGSLLFIDSPGHARPEPQSTRLNLSHKWTYRKHASGCK